MQGISKILISGALLMSLNSFAQMDCQIDISIANITKGDVVPEAINSKLEGKLMRAMGAAGLMESPYDSRFFIAGRFDDAFNDVTGGPSQKNYVKTTLTLYIGDAEERKVFATESFELSGVGGSETQAYTKALNKISATNPKLIEFLKKGHETIINYFNTHYQTYLDKAKQAVAARNYDEALYYATLVPSCSRGYDQAHTLAMSIYGQRMNYDSQQLLAEAKAAWAADPTASGAALAHSYLVQIDPSASCYKEAQNLSAQMSKTTQKQWDFENVTKYKDQVALEKHRITAAKEAAVAWAKSRPKTVNRFVFLRR